MKNKKSTGEVFTPNHIVKNILDFCGYYGQSNQHIIDNSCGDGAFLLEIVDRYCKNYKENNLKESLEKYIHGIEINKENYNNCLNNLNNLVSKYNIYNVKWDIINDDALNVSKFNGKMDYVVGNPPYVRNHNINNLPEIKKHIFSTKGMTDLYITFYEISFLMLNNSGKMCLITPSSWFTSKAGEDLRKYILSKKNLCGIIDLGHYQPFNATTYTAIAFFDNKNKYDKIKYNILNEKGVEFQDILNYNDFNIDNKFYFLQKNQLNILKNILSKSYYKNEIDVKNGFATLSDNVFIGDFNYKECIDVIKASTGKWMKCIFPYNKDGKLIYFEKLDVDLQKYLIDNKDILVKRDIEDYKNWYSFGRTQGLLDVYKTKISINTIIKDVDSIKLNLVPVGSGVYSGLYIITNYSIDDISKVILSDDFIEYVASLKKYKSGGYYTFSSTDLKKYLNYQFGGKYEQPRLL